MNIPSDIFPLATAVAAGIVQAKRNQILHPKMAHGAERHWLAGRLLLLGHRVVLSMKEKAGWASQRKNGPRATVVAPRIEIRI